MAIAVRGIGAYGSGTTSFTAAVPTGGSAPVSGDAMYIVMESSDSVTGAGTPSTPTNWTKILEDTHDDGLSTVTTLTIFGKIAGGSESDVSVTGVGDHCSGRLFAISGHGLAAITDTVTSAVSKSNGTTFSITGATVSAGSLILVCVATGRDAIGSTLFSNWADASLTDITEIADDTVSTGSGGGIGVASGLCAGTTSGTVTGDLASSVRYCGAQLGIAPAAAAATTKNLGTLGVG